MTDREILDSCFLVFDMIFVLIFIAFAVLFSKLCTVHSLQYFTYKLLELKLKEDNQENMTLKWQSGVLSNFDYLLFLNR